MTAAPTGSVLVTGGTGFIGGHLVRALVAQGCRPLLLARVPGSGRLIAGLEDRVRWAQADLRETERVRDLLLSVRPDTLFHLAGARGRGVEGALDCAAVNILATLQLLAAAREAGVRRAILLGSAAEYGPQPGPWHEDLPLLGASPYAISKAAATRFALGMNAPEGLSVVVLRPFTVYGPGQPADMFVAEAVGAALRETRYGVRDDSYRQDLVYVGDVVRALLAASGDPAAAGQVVNVGSGRAVALREIARRIWDLTGSPAPLQLSRRRLAADDPQGPAADPTRARQLLGWEPRVDLERGLRATIEWEREQLARESVVPVQEPRVASGVRTRRRAPAPAS